MPVAPVAADDRLSDLVAAALDADARLEPADSLYTDDALIVADGQPRQGPPRFAGVGTGGTVAVTSSRLEVRGATAWVHVEYRWLSAREGTAKEGRATLVFTPDDKGAWRIRHAHSSSPPSG